MKSHSKKLIEKAALTLEATELLLKARNVENAAGRAYYAMFYIAKALLCEKGLEDFKKHSAVHAAYPKKFDASKITNEDKLILSHFFKRRKIFDDYLKANEIKLFTCPSCGYPTLNERGGYEICTICDWEDDNQDNETADEIWGGPNSNLSLTESRLQIGHVLNHLARDLHGAANLSAKEVLEILKDRDAKIDAFQKENISDRTHRNEPIWTKYSELKKTTLNQLIKK